jgi:uncharacterized protein (TIGR03067 family)
MYLRTPPVLLGLCLAVFAVAPRAMAAEENLDGVWKPTEATMGGQALPPPFLAAVTLAITGETYEMLMAGGPGADRGTCVVDRSVTPHRITIKCTEGPSAGTTTLAIFEFVDADTMRVCSDLAGAGFPAAFASPAGTQLFLTTYARQKE